MKQFQTFFVFFLFLFFSSFSAQQPFKKDTFNFSFEGKKMSGFIWSAPEKKLTKLIFIVPGSGTTSFGKGNRYYDSLIARFVNAGYLCFAYDKQGNGESEGTFSQNEDIHISAKEVHTALATLRKRKIPGAEKPGMWGLSRAGWVCPLVIAADRSIAFWISVSGVDDKETYTQMLDCWFRLEAGKSEAESKMLVQEWIRGNYLGMTNGSPEQYLEATKHLRADSFYVKKVGYKPIDPVKFVENQKKSHHELSEFDAETGLYLYVHNFKETMSKVKCPVLAIFGEQDCNVDWSRTMNFYKETLGRSTDLTIRSFPNCNHNLQKSETGLPDENLKKFGWVACGGYYATMVEWLGARGK